MVHQVQTRFFKFQISSDDSFMLQEQKKTLSRRQIDKSEFKFIDLYHGICFLILKYINIQLKESLLLTEGNRQRAVPMI